MILLYYANVEDLNVAERLREVDNLRASQIRGTASEEEKKRRLGAGLLLEAALKSLGIKRPKICRADAGKPYFEGVKDLFFNLSHSGKYAACALSDTEVGVDIERIQSVRWTLCNKKYSPKEQAYVKDAADSAEAFTRVWTLRESYLKALGTGLLQPFSSFETDPVRPGVVGEEEYGFRIWRIDGYLLTLCARELPERAEEIVLDQTPY